MNINPGFEKEWLLLSFFGVFHFREMNVLLRKRIVYNKFSINPDTCSII
jgi:hypothetical protein